VPAPKALQTAGTVPWLYRGSDVPVDDKWLFGEMKNGLRYAVRRNGVPPGQVSIRVRVDDDGLRPVVRDVAAVAQRRRLDGDDPQSRHVALLSVGRSLDGGTLVQERRHERR
jgi:hypothetical protein